MIKRLKRIEEREFIHLRVLTRAGVMDQILRDMTSCEAVPQCELNAVRNIVRGWIDRVNALSSGETDLRRWRDDPVLSQIEGLQGPEAR